LNLYEARPKTGKDIFGTPSISVGYDGTGALTLCEPEKGIIFVSLKQLKECKIQTVSAYTCSILQ